jgi:hypothetical protein
MLNRSQHICWFAPLVLLAGAICPACTQDKSPTPTGVASTNTVKQKPEKTLPSDELPVIGWGDSKPLAGWTTRKGDTREYQILSSFGVEVWEGSKRSIQNQRWTVNCRFPDYQGKLKTYCSVQVLSIYPWADRDSLPSVDEYSTVDGNLEITDINWEKGQLDFDMLDPNKDRIHVFITLGTREKTDQIFLESFKASITVRQVPSGEVTTYEFKVPDYTYTLQLPLEMRGMATQGEKQWDDMIKTLSKEDQLAWAKLKAKGPEGLKMFGAEFQKSRDRQFEQLKARTSNPTPAEDKRLAEAMIELYRQEYGRAFSNSGISKDGQKVIVEFLSKKQ